MARSEYIYLVKYKGEDIAAFTAKYEMENFLHDNWTPGWNEDTITLWRFKDNRFNPAEARKPVQMHMITTKNLELVGIE